MKARRYLTGKDVTAPPGHCRWCKRSVKPPKRTWCSQRCVDEYLLRASPQRARAAVLDRDQGLCRGCGLDVAALERAIMLTRARVFAPLAEEAREALALLGFHRLDWQRTLWEADHIVPVVRGGGGCGLENLRVLCLPCHRQATAELARTRAAERRTPGPAPTRQEGLPL